MKKKILIVLSAIIIILIVAYLYKSFSEPYVGKSFNIMIEDDSDYTILDDPMFSAWNEKNRDKMKDYMKKNDLKIEAGEYTLNQVSSFKEAIGIFRFVEP